MELQEVEQEAEQVWMDQWPLADIYEKFQDRFYYFLISTMQS